MSLSDEQVRNFVRQRILSSSARRTLARTWLDYYQGDQAQHVPKNPDESEDHFRKRPKVTVNLTRRIIDAKSCLYDQGAERDSADPVVRQLWADVDIDERLREADPMVRLCGDLVVFPDYVLPSRGIWPSLKRWLFGLPDAGRFMWHVYTPDRVEVDVDPDFPDVPRLLAVFWPALDAKGVQVIRSQVWSAEKVWSFSADRQERVEPHPFRRIPFAVLRGERNWTADFWGRGEAANIVPQNQEINRLCSSLEWLVLCQSHGQWVIKNAPENWKPKLGTDQVLLIYDEDETIKSDVQLIAPSADPEGMRASIDWLADKLAESADVPSGAYRLDVNRQSGASLIEKRFSTDRYRRRRRPQARAWERELAALARIVWAGRTGQPLPADVPEIRVNWSEPDPPQQTVDRVAREEHELRTGQSTVPQQLRRHDPDLTIEEAERRHRANLAYNRSTAAALTEGAGSGEPVTPEARALAAAAVAAAAGGPEPPPSGGGGGGDSGEAVVMPTIGSNYLTKREGT